MALYMIRSERMSCEQLAYSMLFCWFLELDKPSFDHSSFITNHARLLGHPVAGEFFFGVVEQARTVQANQSAISRCLTYRQPVSSSNEQTES
jgi:transposase